jgi:hypothetical protein
MDKSDFSDIERELRYQDFMIRYLQEEQKKRREELNELEQKMLELKVIQDDLDRLQKDPRFQKLIKLALERSTK